MTLEIQTQDIVHLTDSNLTESRFKAVCGCAFRASTLLEDRLL